MMLKSIPERTGYWRDLISAVIYGILIWILYMAFNMNNNPIICFILLLGASYCFARIIFHLVTFFAINE